MTTKANIKNEKVKEEFYDFFQNVKGRDPKTVQAYANAICEFEKFTGYLDFKTFTKNQAMAFKEHLATHRNTGEIMTKMLDNIQIICPNWIGQSFILL